MRGFRTLQEVQKRGQWRAVSSVTRDDKGSRLAADCHSTPPTLRNMLGRLARRAEALFDVFGGAGFLATPTNHLGMRGFVLDTKFGPRYDLTNPLVLTRIRQDVSAGKVTGMITHFVLFPNLSPVLPSQTCIIVLASLGFCNTRVIRGCGTCRKSTPLRHRLARPGPWRILVFLDHDAGSERSFWLGTGTTEIYTVLLAGVSEQVDVAVCQDKKASKGFRITLSRDHTRSRHLSFALAIFLIMKARRYQRTHPLRGMASSLDA